MDDYGLLTVITVTPDNPTQRHEDINLATTSLR